ncbi:hypothetical protein M407DRAFT_24989 [Tulasnella calospora MUT 4182]|uniref:F-box domain-containing protein n=1 Tax=Tulasnella calospora MUT 4182 TaxID=1051891 RepID=A0A0C3KW92_9AGAM|nr:hypothetical protein M407DRAFT_24989 [Tulasnella calospora MUT 4182]
MARLWAGLVWWPCYLIFLPFYVAFKLLQMLVGFALYMRRLAEKLKWRHYPQYPNGTLITGRLTESELAAASQATTRLSSSTWQRSPVPFLPPEIVREIVRHATDTFPAPSSIHYPSLSTSQSLSPPPHDPRFPYSSYAFQGGRDIDRKLHTLSMKIKLSVSRVSRTWRNVAVEFLFNSIRVQDSTRIPLLWHALEGDAKRRGEQITKESIARPGSAPWWIREVWIDLKQMKHGTQPDFAETPPSFDLDDLLKICPNIVVYRGLGRWRQFQSPSLSRHTAVLKQILGLPGEMGDETHGGTHEVQDSEFKVPDAGRRIQLGFGFEWEPGFPLLGNRPIPTPHTLTLPCISTLELRNLSFFTTDLVPYNTFQLPNLVHLSWLGEDSLEYATTRLILPSLRSITLGRDTRWPHRFLQQSPLESFLEKHGLALEELTVLAKSYLRYPQRLDQLCPVLQTFRAHYLELPKSAILSVRNVGLYGLEHARGNLKLGENLISSIFKVFPDVATIQDLSWRSGVIRRRAYTNWTDPEGARHRAFWTQVFRTVRTAGGNDKFSAREVTLLDWRGKPVDTVPTKSPEGQRAVLGPDDQLLDALVSVARNLIES